MFAQCINCPTGLILRGVECWPRRLNEIDEAGLKPLRLLVVAPECGRCLKFSAPGTDEFVALSRSKVVFSPSRPVPLRAPD